MLDGFAFPVIFGIGKVERSVSSVFGVCPSCAGEKIFRLVEVSTAWLVLAIPVRRYNKSYYVRCTNCKRIYKESEILMPVQDEFAELASKIKHLVVGFLVNTCQTDEQLMQEATRTLSTMFGNQVSMVEFDNTSHAMLSQQLDTMQLARELAVEVGEATRRKVFDAVVQIIKNAGRYTLNKNGELHSLGEGLNLAPGHVSESLSQTN